MAERKIGDRVLRLVRGDITDLPVQAFVHDVTEDCKLGSGYGGAIAMRGGKAVQEELDTVGTLRTGEAVATTAGNLKAEVIIHVNGPKFLEPDTRGKLTRTVVSALELSTRKGIQALAFPPIGTGLYQVPLDLCASVLVSTVTEHLRGETSLRDVQLVALDAREWGPLAAALEKES